VADGYGRYPGVSPYGYGPMQAQVSPFANALSGALPGIDQMTGMLAQLPMLKMQAEQMEREQTLRNMGTLVQILKLEDPMGGAALEQFGPQLGLDPGLLATIKKGKEEQRREIAGMIEPLLKNNPEAAPAAMRMFTQNPAAAFEFWNKERTRKQRLERFASLRDAFGGPVEQPRVAPSAAGPAPDALGETPAPMGAASAPGVAPPPAPPAPPMTEPPMEPAGAPADWQRRPEYVRARQRVEQLQTALDGMNAGFARFARVADPDEVKEFEPVFKRRFDQLKETYEQARKELDYWTPEQAATVETRDPLTGKTVITSVSKRGEPMGTVGTAPFKGQSTEGKLEADLDQMKRFYGSDSPEATRMRDAVEFQKVARGIWQRAEEQKMAQARKGDFKDVQSLRKEFTDISKPFREAVDGYTRIKVGNATDDLAGDLALIYGYAKMLDPTGAVREGDYNSIANNPGIPGWISDLARGLTSNRRVGPANRAAIFRAASNLYGNYEQTHRQHASEWRRLARDRNFDEDEVVPNFIPPREPVTGATAPMPVPVPGAAPRTPRTPSVTEAEGDTATKAEAARKAIEALHETWRGLQKR
jgi:ribosomal protein L17